MKNLPEEDRAKIAQQVEVFRIEKRAFDNEVYLLNKTFRCDSISSIITLVYVGQSPFVEIIKTMSITSSKP